MTVARSLVNSVASIACAAAIFNAAPAQAAPFDGRWSVLIVTQRGPCDTAYRYGVSIQNGIVLYEGSAPVNLNGRVAPNGAVAVRLWAGSQSASGYGRLYQGAGRGTWTGTGSAGTCSGYWTAEQR